MSTIFGFDQATLTAFDDAYWASQPLPVQALRNMDPSQGARNSLAYQLAGQGYFIDVPVMVWGWDAYMTMYQRMIDGYTTYPDALNTQTRKVDLNPGDYPPVNVPTVPTGVLVGAQIGGPGSPYYYLTSLAAALNLPVGYETTQDSTNSGHTYVLQYTTLQIINGQTSQVPRWMMIS